MHANLFHARISLGVGYGEPNKATTNDSSRGRVTQT